ncbi:16S rRNA (guanine(966)-N(2))-methyltransferase RsmD [Nereida sp. MMG025]|uniref:16S rRNA (guanine(966)-N(2))-methyltransferase RsmD n=1 Tax=Nereida sp. MMG025 TaxID=2909981 RepID=UPI00351D520C|nr:16S rRNA (guanine(966)-N(2))-methyltransferase RsmD [Nereida sp. MMG025]
MRIIAGAHRGLALAAVGKGDAAKHLRPTTDRVRETLFNILNNYIYFDEQTVLDLFAGTGALGLEAASRGATHCTFVDDGRVALRLLAENIAKCQIDADVIKRDATRADYPSNSRFSLVFMDPPYGKDLGQKALANALNHLTDDALVVWEENAPMQAPVGFEQLDQRRFGDTWITILRRQVT